MVTNESVPFDALRSLFSRPRDYSAFSTEGGTREVINSGSCHKRQKPQAPTPQAPIRNRQTRKVANAKGLNRNTNLTTPNLT